MTPSQIILTIKACILLGLLGLAYYLGGASARVDLAQYKTKVMASTAKAADLATKAERIARLTEQAHALALSQVADQYERDKQDAQAIADRLVADLRAGNVKLHQRWQAAQATAKLSGAVASAAELDAAQREREGSAVRIIAAADRCDAQVKGLQEVIRADRK